MSEGPQKSLGEMRATISREMVRLQAEYEAIYCIVDYHALTSQHDADLLRSRTREMRWGTS